MLILLSFIRILTHTKKENNSLSFSNKLRQTFEYKLNVKKSLMLSIRFSKLSETGKKKIPLSHTQGWNQWNCMTSKNEINPKKALQTGTVVIRLPKICLRPFHGRNSYSHYNIWAVLRWLSKNQYQNNSSHQSQQEQTGRWTNRNCGQSPVTCAKSGKTALKSCNWFWFCFSLVEKRERDFLRTSFCVTIAIA